MFNRRSRDTATDATAQAEAEAAVETRKGRPTPKRRDAERERRERIRPPRDSRAAAKQARARKLEARKAMREALDSGDPKFLPKRDQGPVRQMARDFVDGRLTAAEFFMPIAVASLVLMVFGASGLGGSLSSVMIMVVLFDGLIMQFQLRRLLRTRFPDESRRGAVSYGLMRALMWRSLRTPKPTVPRGHRP